MNGNWTIDTLTISKKSGSQLVFGQLGYYDETFSSLNKTFFDVVGCGSPLSIMDCSGNCFNNTILGFIYNDDNCDDDNCDDDITNRDFRCKRTYFIILKILLI